MTRQAIVAANWKMNGDIALVDAMVSSLKDVKLLPAVKVIICPSSLHLALLKSKLVETKLSNLLKVGAQNVNEHSSGAYTGEISTAMLQDLSVNYVILGHSERRSLYNESSTLIAKKVDASLEAEITPILCIGESEAERAAGKTEAVLISQLKPVIEQVGINKFIDVVIAYEPVWAIGTGKTASSAMAQETHQFIRHYLAQQSELVASKVSILYGGSVNAANCKELFAQADIDGGLIGGASLQAEQFKIICTAAKGK
jgi:triosephosphate isomerase